MQTVVMESDHAATIVLQVPGWAGHLAGQHVDVRLTAPDGYQTERSYSIASAPEQTGVWLTVERIDDGEVSPYLVGTLRPGDQLELRGPIGGHFVWRADDAGPVLLVAGGSGVVPLMAMLRHHVACASSADLRLLVSARTWPDLLYRDELTRLGDRRGIRVAFTLTRSQHGDWTGWGRRVDAAMLREVAPGPQARPAVFVCGPTAFVETVADALVDLGHPPEQIRTERFGPSGP